MQKVLLSLKLRYFICSLKNQYLWNMITLVIYLILETIKYSFNLYTNSLNMGETAKRLKTKLRISKSICDVMPWSQIYNQGQMYSPDSWLCIWCVGHKSYDRPEAICESPMWELYIILSAMWHFSKKHQVSIYLGLWSVMPPVDWFHPGTLCLSLLARCSVSYPS